MCLFSVNHVPIPLKRVTVKAQLLDAIAQVFISQSFINTESNPIEAIYEFPLDVNSAVFSFSVVMDGKEIEGVIKEKEQARNIYDDAIGRT